MTEADIQELLKDHETKLRSYLAQLQAKTPRLTPDIVEGTYYEVFEGGTFDIVEAAMNLLANDKKKLVPSACRSLEYANIVKKLSLD